MQKIMIIEDEPSVREELAILLNNEGYQALVINDFVNIPEQAADSGPDLILLDLGLPGRDGFSCARISTAKQASQSSSSPPQFRHGRAAGAESGR
ncbi:MAG: response regulator transcription factor [Eisenbergiella sp.]